ncbi:MAG: 30S ribosomal protein S9 [Bacteroidia bacterium]|jgi:small subunit ribosomal protein S9
MSQTNTIGRRKTAVARIYMSPGSGSITVNGRPYNEYFPLETLQQKVNKAFAATQTLGQYDVKANLSGGGVSGQADALLLALARALKELNPDFHTPLKAEKLLTRDPRMVERKKFGRRKARRRFQFSKR